MGKDNESTELKSTEKRLDELEERLCDLERSIEDQDTLTRERNECS